MSTFDLGRQPSWHVQVGEQERQAVPIPAADGRPVSAGRLLEDLNVLFDLYPDERFTVMEFEAGSLKGYAGLACTSVVQLDWRPGMRRRPAVATAAPDLEQAYINMVATLTLNFFRGNGPRRRML